MFECVDACLHIVDKIKLYVTLFEAAGAGINVDAGDLLCIDVLRRVNACFVLNI